MGSSAKDELEISLRKMIQEKGEIPTRHEFMANVRGADYRIKKYYGNYTNMINSFGLAKLPEEKQSLANEFEKKFKKIVSKKEQIHGFFRHTLDLEELFKKAGNPEVLKVVWQPDTHLEEADEQALKVFEDFCMFYQPHVHGILGDFLGCSGASHWPAKDLTPKRMVPEIKHGRIWLKNFRNKVKSVSTGIYLEGNHENWIQQMLLNMPEFFDGLSDLGIEINLNTLLGLESFGYDFFPVNHLIQIGKAHFTHGIYTGSAHAKKHLDVFKTNIFYGHLHDTQNAEQTSVEGPMVSQSLGCLCKLDAKFLKGRPNNWSHAFGVFEFFPDGSFTYFVPRIINGKMSFCGQIFDGSIK